MRRGSFVAPLLLIGIGALFLARNVYPDLPLLDYLARYWPFLLILWGGLRLVEILAWAATDRPVPARGISGGEWVLAIFLCFLGGTIQMCLGMNIKIEIVDMSTYNFIFQDSFRTVSKGQNGNTITAGSYLFGGFIDLLVRKIIACCIFYPAIEYACSIDT